MMKKEQEQRQVVEMYCTDMLVPSNHLLRKIDAAVNFDHIYEIVSDLYSRDTGRPSIDPVVLFKLVIIQHLYGIRSLRQTVKDAEVNVAYRWFIGYTMTQAIPHFATISYAFSKRFTPEVIEQVFSWILNEANEAGYLEPEVVFVDSTHIKANANVKKRVKKQIPKAARQYEKQLMEEVNQDREAHGKKPFDDDPSKPTEEKIICESTTDPESGLFHKGEHKKCFAYGAHTVCDKNNFILDYITAPGNIHDSIVFDALYRKFTNRFPEIKVIVADAGYKTPWICKLVFDDGRIASLPYKRPMTKRGNLPGHKYVYDEYYDCILCPEGEVLSYSTTNRDGYREYKSKADACQNCPSRSRCTQSRNCTKTVTRHIWTDYLELAEDIRHSDLGKETYAMRSKTIERVFADAKEKYGMRFTPYRGLTRVSKWVGLIFAAMNLKKLAVWKWKARRFLELFWDFCFSLLLKLHLRIQGGFALLALAVA